MDETAPTEKINFTLSESAGAYLQKHLPGWVDIVVKRGRIPVLSHAGRGHTEGGGKAARFGIGGLAMDDLKERGGKYHEVVGCAIWIPELECILLKGRILTTGRFDGPGQDLAIENVPEDYYGRAFNEMAGASS